MIKKKSKYIRFVAVLCAVVLTAVSPAGMACPSVKAESKSSLQSQLDDLAAEEDRLNDQIAAYKDDLNKQQAYLDSINEKISNAQAQIDVLTEKINGLDEQIYAKEQEIAEKEQQISDREQEIPDAFAKLQQRLRAISKSGNMSARQMLMDTDEYTDYLIKSKMMERIAQNDQQLMDQLEAEITKINQEKKKVEDEKKVIDDQKAVVAADKSKADDKKAELDTLYSQANSVAKKLEGSISNYKDQLAANQQKQEETEQALQELIREEIRKQQQANAGNNSGGSSGGSSGGGSYSYGGGTMTWPVPAVRNISSGYGYRWGAAHRGVDISEGAVPVYGQTIVAAASGRVIYVNNSNSWGSGASWGYGYCVIIDHGTDANGNNVTTLYAHCSAVYAYVGQSVSAGDAIAAAGATGDVTGPHLHFEVRLNGSAVDPIANGYLRG